MRPSSGPGLAAWLCGCGVAARREERASRPAGSPAVPWEALRRLQNSPVCGRISLLRTSPSGTGTCAVLSKPFKLAEPLRNLSLEGVLSYEAGHPLEPGVAPRLWAQFSS